MSAALPGRVAILIPALNEELAIRRVVESALAILPDVLVVDDGSSDHTVELLTDLPVILLRHETPLGKGESLRAGFREALRRGFSAVITMDGDGQHDAADIPRMLAAADQFPGHLVIGARIHKRENQPNARRRANAIADWGLSWACGIPVVDTQSGQRYYPRAALELVDLPAQGFVFEAAILIAAVRERKIGVVSIPIDARYNHEFRRSHFRPVQDVTRIVLFTIQRVLHYGNIVESYKQSHNSEPCVVNPQVAGKHAAP